MTDEVLILNLKRQGKNYKVETSIGEYRFSEDTIIRFLILKDKVFSKASFEDIISVENTNSLLNKTLNFLSYQQRSEGEIRKYLAEKASGEEIELIISKLESMGYLNDEAFGENLLDYAQRTGKGPRYLEERMQNKGLSEELISKFVRIYQEDEEEVLDLVIEKHLQKNKSFPIKKQKQKLYQKLLRDGFSRELIAQKLSRIEFFDESDERLKRDFQRLLIQYENLDDREKQKKIYNRLLARGYAYDDISSFFYNQE
jgi:regulatory protein